jgi:hypothetical protein
MITRIKKYAVFSIIILSLLPGCSSKPTQQIDDAKKEFETTLTNTIAGVYIGGLLSSLHCSEISDVWKIATESGHADINELIQKAKKSIGNTGLDKILNTCKEEVDSNMKRILNPPLNYRIASDLLLDMYGYFLQLYHLAVSPSGSYISFNRDFNQYYGELEKDYEKILIIMPGVKDEVESRIKKIEQQKKL